MPVSHFPLRTRVARPAKALLALAGLVALQWLGDALVAHAIGVARVLQTHPASVAFAALAMGLNGVATALVLAMLSRWL